MLSSVFQRQALCCSSQARNLSSSSIVSVAKVKKLGVIGAFCKAVRRIPSVSTNSPGFLANRILMLYINKAIICLETGI